MELYLDRWTASKIGAEHLTRENLEGYQLQKLKETVEFARKNSRFYEEKLSGFSVENMDDFRWLPFTRPDELSERGEEMICVSAGEISRIVTLETGRKQRDTQENLFYGGRPRTDGGFFPSRHAVPVG